jgi:hypothetical protein
MLRDFRGIPLEQAAQVRPQHLAEYAKSRHWRRVQTANESIAVYAHPEAGHYEQILIPREPVADYAERIADAVATLASFEKRNEIEVLLDVLAPDADTLRFAREGRSADAGSLSLIAGIDLLEGAKRALLASACSVIAPSRHHPRLSRTEADQLLAASRLQHTERGSFVVAISCPLRAVDSDPTLFDDLPFARRATSLLMRSLGQLVHAIESDRVKPLYEDDDTRQPLLSANLCEAILRMQPDPDEAIRVTASWAPTLPNSDPACVPSLVRIPQEYFPLIATVRDGLRPPTNPKSSLFIGTVETLNGGLGDDGRRSGEVSLHLMHENELIRARVDLDAEQYAEADRAHMAGSYVQIEGVLAPGRRVHRIAELGDFRRIGPSSRW